MTEQERLAAALEYQGATAAPPTMAQQLAKVPSRLIGALKALGTGSSYGSAEPVNAVNDLARARLGRGSVFGVPEDVQQRNVDRAMEAASIAAPIKRAFSAPQDAALRLAQERAALPVEQGGLGLPPNNTAEQRAAAMGGETGWAHGSPDPTIRKLQSSKIGAEGPGVYATNYLPEASTYSHMGEGATIYPLTILKGKTLNVGKSNPYEMLGAKDDKELLEKLSALGKDSIQATQPATPQWLLDAGVVSMPERQHFVSQNADNFRSRFAAFDPFRRNAAIAAAMGVAAPDLLAKEKKK